MDNFRRVPVLISLFFLVLVSIIDDGSTSPVPGTKYDQRQEGEMNIRADLDNIVIVVVPSGGVRLVDSEQIGSILQIFGNTRHNNKEKTNSVHPTAISPYKVDIEQSAIDKLHSDIDNMNAIIPASKSFMSNVEEEKSPEDANKKPNVENPLPETTQIPMEEGAALTTVETVVASVNSYNNNKNSGDKEKIIEFAPASVTVFVPKQNVEIVETPALVQEVEDTKKKMSTNEEVPVLEKRPEEIVIKDDDTNKKPTMEESSPAALLLTAQESVVVKKPVEAVPQATPTKVHHHHQPQQHKHHHQQPTSHQASKLHHQITKKPSATDAQEKIIKSSTSSSSSTLSSSLSPVASPSLVSSTSTSLASSASSGANVKANSKSPKLLHVEEKEITQTVLCAPGQRVSYNGECVNIQVRQSRREDMERLLSALRFGVAPLNQPSTSS